MYRGFTLGRSPANMLHLKPFNFNYTVGTGTIKESREKIEALLNDLTKGHQGNVDIVAKRKHSALGKHTSIKKPPSCSTD
jgi:hypothetical protein